MDGLGECLGRDSQVLSQGSPAPFIVHREAVAACILTACFNNDETRMTAFLASDQTYHICGISAEFIGGLLTNFHLPESILLMLVSALIGHKETMAVYEEAIKS